jgi:hypothetical protein
MQSTVLFEGQSQDRVYLGYKDNYENLSSRVLGCIPCEAISICHKDLLPYSSYTRVADAKFLCDIFFQLSATSDFTPPS